MRKITGAAIVVASIALLALASCGGGGDRIAYAPGHEPEAASPERHETPAPDHRPSLTPIPAPVTLADVRHYIHELEEDGMRHWPDVDVTAPWSTPPTIRISTSVQETQRRSIRRAVHGINAHLPTNWHLVIGPDMPRPNTLHEIPRGTLFVDHSEHAGSDAWARTLQEWGVVDNAGGFATSLDAGGNIFAAVAFASIHSGLNIGTLQHELLHALGFRAHVYDVSDIGGEPLESEIGNPSCCESWAWSLELPGIDGAALYYLTLGEWSDSVLRIEGEWSKPPQSFEGYGVDWQNGFAVPWTKDNLNFETAPLSSGVWEGGVVGITPSGRAVTGLSRITVNFGAMSGHVDLDRLEHADRSRWGDGDLDYDIAVHGQRFERSGGDAGDLYGRFAGPANASALGTLERTDLTAAFGASR